MFKEVPSKSHNFALRLVQLIGAVGPRSGQPAATLKSRWIPVAAADDFKPGEARLGRLGCIVGECGEAQMSGWP